MYWKDNLMRFLLFVFAKTVSQCPRHIMATDECDIQMKNFYFLRMWIPINGWVR